MSIAYDARTGRVLGQVVTPDRPSAGAGWLYVTILTAGGYVDVPVRDVTIRTV